MFMLLNVVKGNEVTEAIYVNFALITSLTDRGNSITLTLPSGAVLVGNKPSEVERVRNWLHHQKRLYAGIKLV